MCGIVAIVASGKAEPPRRSAVEAMAATLVHRGPDAEGYEVAGPVALGVRRLSVIDVAGGNQPYFSEDGTVRAVFNGEIYNYRELRRDLLRRGHTFASETDGEVIVHLWQEYGPDFASHLNGMFAIALHDTRQARFVLVRDRLGVKPLYYALSPNHLVCGSEIKALLASGLVARDLDLDGLGQFIAWEYVPAPATLFRGIRKLAPGEMMILDLPRFRARTSTWWEVARGRDGAASNVASTPADWADAVEAKLRECVKRQMVADVPLGAFLSGGVDSSLVVSAMGSARAFSIGFEDPSYNELDHATAVAEQLGLDHESETLRPDAVELFDRLMEFMDDPIGDFSIFPTYLVSRLARRRVTVALSGDGGDELFGGYETYIAQAVAGALRVVPLAFWRRVVGPLLRRIAPGAPQRGLVNIAKRFAEGLEHDPALGHARWRLFAGEEARQRLFTPDALARMASPVGAHIARLRGEAEGRLETERALYVDLKSCLSDKFLTKLDRMSMACSLEARVPFLDHELVDLAFAMPATLKVRGFRTKVLLKRVAARRLPRASVYRPKQGFSIPMKTWLMNDFRPLLEDMLSPARLGPEGIFRADAVERLKAEHLSGRANHSHVLWSLIVFQDWRGRWSA